MTLNQLRRATLASLEDGELLRDEVEGILAAIDRLIAAGLDPDPDLNLPGPIIDLDRLGRELAAGVRQGIGAPELQG